MKSKLHLSNGLGYIAVLLMLAMPAASEAVPNTGLADFVNRFYVEILLRQAEEDGLNNWIIQLQSGVKTGEDIANGFILSPEFISRTTSNSEFVDTLYLALFNRIPDLNGKNHWLAQLNAGVDRGTVLAAFTRSEEFTFLSESFGIKPRLSPVESFVSRFYRRILQREPDLAGLTDWSQRLTNANSTSGDIAMGFVFSQEFLNRELDNFDFITILYRAFFDREPDQGGLATWLDQLATGASRQDVVNGFLAAIEFELLSETFGITTTEIDIRLTSIISTLGLTGDPSSGRNLPHISSPMPSLGRLLFFSKRLGGENDAACVSCHHPVFGGADALSLPVGVHAVDELNVADPDLMGPGRHSEIAGNLPLVARNAPTVFNSGMQDKGLFHESRLESLSGDPLANGMTGLIATPDSVQFDTPDLNIPPGTSLPAAQARFPVVSRIEMRANFSPGADHQSIRASLASRFEDISTQWPAHFQAVFGDSSITFNRIADAIGEYERSMVFVNSPWKQYVQGDKSALTDQQKDGALLFFSPVNNGGAGCSTCHSGDFLTDNAHHLTGFPQLFNDNGRSARTGDSAVLYHFRTPSLLNVSETAPYGHAGLYQTLEEVILHYVDPVATVSHLFGEQNGQPFTNINIPFCDLPQIQRMAEASGKSCPELYPLAYSKSLQVLQRMQSNEALRPLNSFPNLDIGQVTDIVTFLESLTDPCTKDRLCLDPWIVDADDLAGFPDNSPVIAHDEQKLDL